MSSIEWTDQEKKELGKIAFLCKRFGGPLETVNITERLNNLYRATPGSSPILRPRRGRKDGQDELSSQMVRRQLQREQDSGHYPLREWHTDAKCQEMLTTEREKADRRGRRARKGKKRLLAEEGQRLGRTILPLNPEISIPKVPWIEDEIKFLVQNAGCMRIFGGYMGNKEFAKWMSSHVGNGMDKPLKPRRSRDGDEFSEDMVQRVVTTLENAEDRSCLPPRARENSKVRRGGDERFMTKENLSVMDTVVLEQQKANRMPGRKRKSSAASDVEGEAMDGPSRRQARKGTPNQAGKQLQLTQRSTAPRLSAALRPQHPSGLAAAETSSVAKGISMLSPHQSSNALQVNSKAQARHPAAQNHNGPISQVRESQQHRPPSRQAELRPSFPFPVLPNPTQASHQPPLPIILPPPTHSRPQLPTLPMHQPHMLSRHLPAGARSNDLPSLRTVIGNHNLPSMNLLSTSLPPMN